MHIVGKICHSIRELIKVRPQRLIVVIAAIAPTVVKDNVVIPSVSQADLDQAIGSAGQQVLVYITGKGVP